MTLKYVLDTSTISRVFGPRFDDAISARFQAATDEMAIASVAWHELVYGMEILPDSARKRELRRFLNSVVEAASVILPYDEHAAFWHATERARLKQIGLTPPFRDGQIAATAFVNGLTVVTANVRDFQNFQGLAIEDWSTGRV